jgi:hypothetical protein
MIPPTIWALAEDTSNIETAAAEKPYRTFIDHASHKLVRHSFLMEHPAESPTILLRGSN